MRRRKKKLVNVRANECVCEATKLGYLFKCGEYSSVYDNDNDDDRGSGGDGSDIVGTKQ